MNKITAEELEGHVRFFKNDPATLQMIGNSKLAKAVGITPDDIETIKMFTEGLVRKAVLIGTFEDK